MILHQCTQNYDVWLQCYGLDKQTGYFGSIFDLDLTGLAIKLYKETRMPENAKETMISHKNMIISFIAELWFWTAMV